MYKGIFNFINNLNTANGCPLTEAQVKEIADDLSGFVCKASIKYIKGQKEHGGHISDRDLDKEIDNELIDLFFYQYARKRKGV